jgi:hypothetical protein
METFPPQHPADPPTDRPKDLQITITDPSTIKDYDTSEVAAVGVGVMPPSPRLRLWQVLREEYWILNGERPNLHLEDDKDQEGDFWVLREGQLKYPQLALCIAQQSNKVSQAVVKTLDEASRNELANFDGSEPLSLKLRDAILSGLRAILQDDNPGQYYGKATVERALSESEQGVEYPELELPLDDKSKLVNRWLLEETFPDAIISIDERLTLKYYQAIQPKNHAALCLSGGGIRSGTFNLGILQGLARHGLLEQFHYLSTVSGGGFSGGWLTAWIKRHPKGLAGVVEELGKPTATPAQQSEEKPPAPKPQRIVKPLDPEPQQLGWLRSYSNFLSPKPGLFSADTWTLVATLLRNIFLNWLVFVPVLMLVLMLPRFWVVFVNRETFHPNAEDFSLFIGFVFGSLALLYIGLNLPSTRRPKRNLSQGAFLWRCLVPLIISAMGLATFAMRARQQGITHDPLRFMAYQVLIIGIPWAICAYHQGPVRKKTVGWGKFFLHIILATLLIVGAQIITGLLLWKAATGWQNNPFFYACFSVPVILALMAFTGLLLAGFTSNYTGDEDQEWWARSGAWVFIAIIGWIAISVLVIYGPYLLVKLLTGLRAQLAEGHIFSKEALAVLGTIASGALSLYGGFSSKTPATDQGAKKSGIWGMLVGLLINIATAVFLVVILISLALLTNVLLLALFNIASLMSNMLTSVFGFPSFLSKLMASLSSLPYVPGSLVRPPASAHFAVLMQTPGWILLLLTLILATLALLFGRLINTNKFSLHYLWRNRIIRAYLGSSNPNRRPNNFTGFDRNDDLRLHELKPKPPGRLLHVLNFALNLVGGEKLAWQERKAESFTASPLHCGNHRLGYRRAKWYGGRRKAGDKDKDQGISLGTSIAISGAFVSPNMGYMQSSPVIRFLMTLFNVRFGWWLGNPGRAGGGTKDLRTYDLDSPRLSVKPIVKEALGMTNDKSDYVYLSDGGHFENFGLYEMVLRRCRLIVVGDATSDAEYTFESLGQSLRKIRIDFGIPITFEKFVITKPSLDEKGVYAAIGTIQYHCIDNTSPDDDGKLILIKPTLTGSETRDILNYQSQSGSFPQEFIGDQWFSESQFESYRALGSHIVDALCKEGDEVRATNPVDGFDHFKRLVENNVGSASDSDFAQKALEFLREISP